MLITCGVQFISGFELFFYQGVDAFKIFTGLEVKDPTDLDPRPLTAMLLSEQNTMSVHPINRADRHNRQRQMPSVPELL